MKKATFISMLALATALVGAAVTAAIYLANKREKEFDEFADELMDDDFDYFATHVEDATEEEPELTVTQEETEDTHPNEH